MNFSKIFILLLLLLLIVPALAQENIDESPITQVSAMQVFTGSLDAVAFSPDGEIIASGGRDNTVRLWDSDTGDNTVIFAGHGDWVTSLAFHPNGNLLVSGGRDNAIWIWDINTGESIALLEHHTEEVSELLFTTDGELLISTGLDGQIVVLHWQTQTIVANFEHYGGAVWDIALSPDGTTLASGGVDGTLWLWGIWDEAGMWLAPLKGHNATIISLVFSPNGNTLLSGDQNGHVMLWDIENAKDSDESIEPLLMEGHLAPVMGVGFTSEIGVAMSTGLDGTVRLWDVDGEIELGKELSFIRGNGAPITHLTLNADRTLAASVGTDGVLGVWNVDTDTIETVIESQRPVVIVNNQTQTTVSNVSQAPQRPTSGRVLSVPSAGIQVGITTFPLDGVSWAINPWEPQVGHLQGTAWIDGVGNMALGGHSQMPDGSAGIFNNLYGIRLGDEVIVQDGERIQRYVVTDIRTVNYTDISVVYPTAHNRVTLITCDIPSFHAQEGIYYERLVVIADMIG